VVLFAISSALTLAVFFLALWLLPFETFTPLPFPAISWVFLNFTSSGTADWAANRSRCARTKASNAPRDATRRYSTPVSGILAPQRVSNLRIVTKL